MSVPFRCGVIEGFYGQPWSFNQRIHLLKHMHDYSLNSYMLAPKFDLHHRYLWTKPYSNIALSNFENLVQFGFERQIEVILSLSPGLSYTADEQGTLIQRFKDLHSTGCTSLALLMDDIPYDRVDAVQQCHLAQELMNQIDGVKNWFICPTVYSRWHLKDWGGSSEYLACLGQELPINWQIFWTGETVISKTINSEDLRDIASILKRKPIIWDNFSADDYVPGHMMFPGPISGRDSGLLDSSTGLMLNPSQLFFPSLSAVSSLGLWFQNPRKYNPEIAFEHAIQKIAPATECQQSLNDLFGYFYSPVSVSPNWNLRLEKLKELFLTGKDSNNLINELKHIRKNLRREENLMLLGEIWSEIYPFVRTLSGDLDYMISSGQKRIDGKPLNQTLIPRDPRWSTPLNDLIQFLLR